MVSGNHMSHEFYWWNFIGLLNLNGILKIRREKVGSVPTLLLVASREQIPPVKNVILVIVILLPVKYLLKLSGPVIFTDYVFFNFYRLFGKFSSTARWKALQSLYCTIRRLFVLFADYSYYSSTIRTIRFTILVLSIAECL
jgi:hypothetical protein